VDPEGAVHSFAAHMVSIIANMSNSSTASIGSRSCIMTAGLQIPKEHAQVAPFVVQMMALAPLLGGLSQF